MPEIVTRITGFLGAWAIMYLLNLVLMPMPGQHEVDAVKLMHLSVRPPASAQSPMDLGKFDQTPPRAVTGYRFPSGDSNALFACYAEELRAKQWQLQSEVMHSGRVAGRTYLKQGYLLKLEWTGDDSFTVEVVRESR